MTKEERIHKAYQAYRNAFYEGSDENINAYANAHSKTGNVNYEDLRNAYRKSYQSVTSSKLKEYLNLKTKNNGRH